MLDANTCNARSCFEEDANHFDVSTRCSSFKRCTIDVSRGFNIGARVEEETNEIGFSSLCGSLKECSGTRHCCPYLTMAGDSPPGTRRFNSRRD